MVAEKKKEIDSPQVRRCPHCGFFLFSIKGFECTTKAVAGITIQTQCQNRRCKEKDEVTLVIRDKG